VTWKEVATSQRPVLVLYLNLMTGEEALTILNGLGYTNLDDGASFPEGRAQLSVCTAKFLDYLYLDEDLVPSTQQGTIQCGCDWMDVWARGCQCEAMVKEREVSRG
jgi:hypothetical protein